MPKLKNTTSTPSDKASTPAAPRGTGHLPLWKIAGRFDADTAVEIVTADADALTVVEVLPMDGENLDQWGEESMSRVRLIANAPRMFNVLCAIRKQFYATPHEKSAGVLLACNRLIEAAILCVESGKELQ